MATGRATYHRRKARVLALQLLYEADISGHPIREGFDWVEEGEELQLLALEYALELAQGVMGQRDSIDSLIQRFAPAWPVRQLPAVDRNILRLALYEINWGGSTPSKVAINEAVELAKTFGSESSPRFVNGVLGSVMDESEATPAERMDEPLATNKNNG